MDEREPRLSNDRGRITVDLGDNQGMPPSEANERVQAIIPRIEEVALP